MAANTRHAAHQFLEDLFLLGLAPVGAGRLRGLCLVFAAGTLTLLLAASAAPPPTRRIDKIGGG